MLDRGKLVIIAILIFATTAAGFALWFQRRQRRYALEFWGTSGGILVRDADEVTLSRLRSAPPLVNSAPQAGEDRSPLETVSSGGRRFEVFESRKLQGVPGLIKLRLALLEDRAFAAASAESASDDWRYALRFKQGGQVTVLLDLDHARIRHLEADREASVAPVASFLRQFVSDQYAGE